MLLIELFNWDDARKEWSDPLNGDYPTYDVTTTPGTSPSGEEYDYFIAVSYDNTSKAQYQLMDVVLDQLAGDRRYSKSTLVDETTQQDGKNTVYTQYYTSPVPVDGKLLKDVLGYYTNEQMGR